MKYAVTILQHTDVFVPISVQWYTIKPMSALLPWLSVTSHALKIWKSFSKDALFSHLLLYFFQTSTVILKCNNNFLHKHGTR